MYDAVRDLDDNVDRMPQAGAWQGRSHAAANAMFGRGTDKASSFKDYTEVVSDALSSGAAEISKARTALLEHADAIDRGGLSVNDLWVVLIRPARVSAEKAASLQAEAAREQTEMNRLLSALGAADNATAGKVRRAAADHGYASPDANDPRTLDPNSGLAAPADDVPNPMTLLGLSQQQEYRQNDMAQTVRDSREEETKDGQYHTTLTMMDGSRHEIQEWGTYNPCVEDVYYDRNGKEISSSFSQDKTNFDGSQYTSIKFPDGTEVTMTRTADGKVSGGVTTGDGRHGVLPDEFFSHPVVTTTGGVLTGLEKQAERGIPMLSAQSVENLAKAGKYGGPALGVATALYDTVTAQTFQDACVAVISGSSGVAGGYAMGGLGAMGATGLGQPEFAPLAAGIGDAIGGWTFGYLGGIIGNVVCR